MHDVGTGRCENEYMATWVYFLWATLLILGSGASWLGTLVTLPGNWGIVLLAALFAWLVPGSAELHLTWTTVGVLVALALIGELAEAFASAAGAARQGASRRSVLLSLVGAVAGSITGVAVGLPVPIVGSAIAAVVGGAAGAFAGAAIGEHWKGRPVGHQVQVGRAALFGRLWGTVAKLVIGIVMVVLVAADVLT
jgi:uncharacterized protein YqgC (DUF456 family)